MAERLPASRERNKRLRAFRDTQRAIQIEAEESVRQVRIAQEQIKKLIANNIELRESAKKVLERCRNLELIHNIIEVGTADIKFPKV